MEKIEEPGVDLEAHFGQQPTQESLQPREDAAERVAEHSPAERDASYKHILSKVKTQQPAVQTATLAQDASSLHQATDRESQIVQLLDLAKTKGVDHAVRVAEHARDYYVLDQMHDRLLSDDFHDALAAAGLIRT